jgi:glycosyltransferase involved in cell wall biosynthesis
VRDLVCFSHLRWGFVFQRPQHLMRRAARDRRVYFIEEPVPGPAPGLNRRVTPEAVHVCVPALPPGLTPEEAERRVADELCAFAEAEEIVSPTAWLYTPMMLPWAEVLEPGAVVYDCMDELSAFRFAPPALVDREAALLRRADLVFAGGRSLWEARRAVHPSPHLFPSSVDVAHFAAARAGLPEPPELRDVPRPRLGYAGVIDERMDMALVAGLAARRPDWSVVLLGPTAKITPDELPTAPNIHRVGLRGYAELPAYLAAFDTAILPFRLDGSTRYISPTKTPEYLAAGLPVVSTPILDVVRDYADRGLVEVAMGVDAFVEACAHALATRGHPERLARVDAALSRTSWEDTWARMAALIAGVEQRPEARWAR